MNSDTRPVMVTIRCLAYNHEPYIRQCLEGFVRQQTTFRFEAIVHDDASTDATPLVIREYAEKYPDIIKPIFETENLYSKNDGSLQRRVDGEIRGKYVAQCEGDDYWSDPLKLQKQFELMEAHPEYSLCFHAYQKLYASGEQRACRPSVIKESYSVEDAILGGGGFMSLCSTFYRFEYLKRDGRPAFWLNCPAGDYAMVLFFADKGRLGYIDEVMSVYRANAVGSWSSKFGKLKDRTRLYQAIIRMLDEFDQYADFRYHDVVVAMKRRKAKFHRKDVVKTCLRKVLRPFTSLLTR